jgi:hypothetical protein
MGKSGTPVARDASQELTPQVLAASLWPEGCHQAPPATPVTFDSCAYTLLPQIRACLAQSSALTKK